MLPQAGARRKIIVFDGQQRLAGNSWSKSAIRKQQMQGFFFSLLV
ncbi:MAG: hypothetical protein ACFWT4_10930 [Citrobacter braakii]